VNPTTQLVLATRREPGRSWGDALDVFLAAISDRPNTRRAYGWAVRRAFVVMGVATIDQITPYDLALYRESIMDWQVSPSTRRSSIGAVRSFLRWSRAFGLHQITADVIDVALRMPTAKTMAPYTILSDPELEDLLAQGKRPRESAREAIRGRRRLRVRAPASED
jgi:site-specific recombinase XerD